MTIQEAIKDGAAIIGALGTIATVIAHLPFIPASWAEALARFASYTSRQFDVTRKAADDTIQPEASKPNEPPAS